MKNKREYSLLRIELLLCEDRRDELNTEQKFKEMAIMTAEIRYEAERPRDQT